MDNNLIVYTAFMICGVSLVSMGMLFIINIKEGRKRINFMNKVGKHGENV